MKFLMLLITTLLLAGCEYEVYRYPCQDPANWSNPECQKPQCEVSRTCPEQIFKSQGGRQSSVSKFSPQEKGSCK